jgi:cell division protein FtsQ
MYQRDDSRLSSERAERNARERVEARRRDRRRPADTPSHARPGGRFLLVDGLRNGRLFSLVLFALSTLLLFGSLFSDRFRVAAVEISGARLVDVDALRTELAVIGERIWLVDPQQVLAVVYQSPYVEAADLQLQLPGTALVRIIERQPEVRWVTNGTEYLVDAAGLVIGPAQTAAELGTLVIVDSSNLPVEPRSALDSDALALARELALRLPTDYGLFPSEIGWDIGLGVFVRMGDGRVIVFGQQRELERKLAVLAYLQNDGTAYTFLDLRPANPYYRNTPVTPEG